MKLKDLLENKKLSKDEIQDVVDDEFVDLSGEVPSNSDDYQDLINRINEEEPKDRKTVSKLFRDFVDEYDFEETIGLEQTRQAKKEIEIKAKKLPGKRLKLK